MIFVCGDCKDRDYPWRPRTWRYPCEDCASGFKVWHEEAFPGHLVNVVPEKEYRSWGVSEAFKTSSRNGW